MNSLRPVKGRMPDHAAIAQVGHISDAAGRVAQDGERSIDLEEECLYDPSTLSSQPVNRPYAEMIIRDLNALNKDLESALKREEQK